MDDQASFRLHFFTRMLFSALVDADFLETEAFHDRVEGRPRERGWRGSLAGLRGRLETHLAAIGRATAPINAERAWILSHVRAGAKHAPGLFSLTVPTGGGKTLTSLAFALGHAIRHELERVIYVIPNVSIIEQTAAVFRKALGDADAGPRWSSAPRPSRRAVNASSRLARLVEAKATHPCDEQARSRGILM
ncbi:MAG: hypothetical protein KatS3mg118_2583 [Paracoccaceae bacterium]|nr:MAG: hypothetical protein KatS3mg118_2583 [Paracoccaceae bacterium]